MGAHDESGVRPRRRRLKARRLVLITGLTSAMVIAAALALMGPGGTRVSSFLGGTFIRQTAGPSPSAQPVAAAPAASGAAASRQVLPPAGSQVQDVLAGRGTLVYRCEDGRYTLARTALQMFVEHGGFAGTQTGLLTWRFKNGTRVDAALVRQVRRPATMSQALLKVVKVSGGDANDRATTYIVRLPSSGGLPPATCAAPGELRSVPFQTRYVFYRSGPRGTPTADRRTLSVRA